MKTIQILWWKWQHAENLIDREIFKWCNIEQIEKWNTPINNLNTLFITPISKTKEIITNLTKNWWDSDFINLSWIMSTTPEEDRMKVENMHFMFGPKAESNLKVVISEVKSKMWKLILDNSIKKWIRIIESTREEHDTNVAITQWLTHFLILISWIISKENKLIKEWNTPIETINDMVNFNDSSIIEINDFLGTLSTWTNIFKSYLDFVTNSLNEKQRYDFWTPSFSRVFNFCEENNFILDEESLGEIMKLDRDNFIDSIHTIRENTWEIKLFI